VPGGAMMNPDFIKEVQSLIGFTHRESMGEFVARWRPSNKTKWKKKRR
jgi:hypothetical protein